MTIIDKVIDYSGFDPSGDENTLLKSALERVHMEAPSDSFTKLFFKKVGSGYEGILKVNSSIGSFSAKEKGQELITLAESLMQKIRGQLTSWKNMRFHSLDFE